MSDEYTIMQTDTATADIERAERTGEISKQTAKLTLDAIERMVQGK